MNSLPLHPNLPHRTPSIRIPVYSSTLVPGILAECSVRDMESVVGVTQMNGPEARNYKGVDMKGICCFPGSSGLEVSR